MRIGVTHFLMKRLPKLPLSTNFAIRLSATVRVILRCAASANSLRPRGRPFAPDVIARLVPAISIGRALSASWPGQTGYDDAI
jgi:hypothetical protein